MRALWYRVVVLRSPEGLWESLLFCAVVYACLVGAGLALLIPILFLGCGPGLCGFAG